MQPYVRNLWYMAAWEEESLTEDSSHARCSIVHGSSCAKATAAMRCSPIVARTGSFH